MEQIVKHEIGHVLGLGHANFDGNLMAAQVNRGIGTVSSLRSRGRIRRLTNGGLKNLRRPNHCISDSPRLIT